MGRAPDPADRGNGRHPLRTRAQGLPAGDRCDVLVAGAGPAGLSTAIALARAGWDTVVVAAPRRVTAALAETLPSAARPWLERLAVLRDFEDGIHRPVGAIRATWGSPLPHETPGMLSPYGAGWRVDRGRLEAALRREAVAAGVRLVEAKLVEVGGDEERRVVITSGQNGPIYLTPWLVDATGRAAAVARRLGARVHVAARLVAAVGTGTASAGGAHQRFSLVEAVRDGWWYSAPLDTNHAVLFFTLPSILRSYPSLAAALRDAPRTRERVGDVPAPPRVVAAHVTMTRPCAGPGWVAVGDAAHSLDPLASTGVLDALRGGLRVAEAVAAALVGGPAAVDRYAVMQEATFQYHLRQRAYFYRAERRWVEAPFWLTASGRTAGAL